MRASAFQAGIRDNSRRLFRKPVMFYKLTENQIKDPRPGAKIKIPSLALIWSDSNLGQL
jgi:hypothetical protein